MSNLKAVSYWCSQNVQETVSNPYTERWRQSSEDEFRKRRKHPREVRQPCVTSMQRQTPAICIIFRLNDQRWAEAQVPRTTPKDVHAKQAHGPCNVYRLPDRWSKTEKELWSETSPLCWTNYMIRKYVLPIWSECNYIFSNRIVHWVYNYMFRPCILAVVRLYSKINKQLYNMCVGYSGGNEISSYNSGWHGFGPLWTGVNIMQIVPIATEPGISLIILTPIKILQRNIHTLQTHSSSFLTQRTYSCANFVVIP